MRGSISKGMAKKMKRKEILELELGGNSANPKFKIKDKNRENVNDYF
jgi:hypothetical protein